MKLNHVILAFALTLPGVAYAHNCPNLMAEIDAALAAKPELNEETISEIKSLRLEGESHHAAGEHVKAEDALFEALTLLGKS